MYPQNREKIGTNEKRKNEENQNKRKEKKKKVGITFHVNYILI